LGQSGDSGVYSFDALPFGLRAHCVDENRSPDAPPRGAWEEMIDLPCPLAVGHPEQITSRRVKVKFP
jgi:hypothetical protein